MASRFGKRMVICCGTPKFHTNFNLMCRQPKKAENTGLDRHKTFFFHSLSSGEISEQETE